MKILSNPYLDAINKQFNQNLSVVFDDTLDVDEKVFEIDKDAVRPVSIITGKVNENSKIEDLDILFSIIPDWHVSTLLEQIDDHAAEKEVNYQLIQYRFHPGGRFTPPEVEDIVVGEFKYYGQALRKAVDTYINGLIDYLWLCVAESELEKN